MRFRKADKPFVRTIFHLYQYGKNAYGRKAVGCRVKDQPFFSHIVNGKNGEHHKACLRNTGVSQHSFYALLKYSGKVPDDERCCSHDSCKQLPLWLNIAESAAE